MHMPDHPTASLDMRVLLSLTRGRNKLPALGPHCGLGNTS